MNIGLYFPRSDFKTQAPEYIMSLKNIHNKAIDVLQRKILEEEGIDLKPSPASGYRTIMGLLTVAGLLKKEGYNVCYYSEDYMKEKNYQKMFKELTEKDILFIAYSVSQHNLVKEFCSKVKELNSNCIIFLMGVLPTYKDKEVLEEINCDVVIRGEGELKTKEICNILEKEGKKGLKKVRGISFKTEGKLKRNKTGKIPDLDDFPSPAFEILPKDYRDNAAIAMATSRGCPFSCRYCYECNFWGNVRFRSVDRVLEDIESYFKNFNFNHIFFYDPTFTYNKKRSLEILNRAKSEFGDFYFACNMRARTVTENYLKKMRNYGCIGCFIGLQNANNSVLKKVNRLETVETFDKAIYKINKYVPLIDVSCIIGLPGENYQTFSNTMVYIKKLLDNGIFQVSTRVFVPYPGTPFFENPEKYGIKIISKNYSRYERYLYPPVYKLKELNQFEIYSFFVTSYSMITGKMAQRVGLEKELEKLDSNYENEVVQNIHKVKWPVTGNKNEN